MKRSQKGYNLALIIVVIAVLGVIFAGWNVISKKNSRNQDASNNTVTGTKPSELNNSNPTFPTENQYLNIPEAGIKIKLSNNILDAYYFISSKKDTNNLPVIYLSTHSLDTYPDCKASNDTSGIAAVATFKKGDTDPVVGDFSTAYPDSPLIKNLYYYTDAIQFDCTQQKNEDKFTQVRNELSSAYKNIESLSQ